MKMMCLQMACLLMAVLTANVAVGHARLKPSSTTPPRNNSTGLKSPPCGGIARTSTPKTYKPGEEIEVQWEETINHPGYFKVSFSKENDANFEEYVLIPNFVDNQDAPIANGVYHPFSAKVKLPNISCETCTLQLIQYMTENPANPSLYYSCSDIRLSDTPGPGSTPAGPPPSGKKPDKPTGLKVKKK